MAVIDRIQYHDVEGLRVGKFPSRISTTCTLYRLGDVLIDTGPPNQWRWVERFIAEKNLRRVLLTHHHEDHAGNGARIQQQFHVDVVAHEKARPYLQKGFHVHLYRQVIWGRPGRFAPAPVEEELHVNDVRIRPVYAPGHSDDMICFYLPDRGWLFTGDLYIAGRLKYMRRDEDPLLQMQSLREVLQLDFQTLFCAHRGVVENGRQALQEKLAFLEELQEQVQHLASQGLSLGEITRRLLGREDFLSWATLFHFSKRNLIRAFMPQLG